MEKELIWFIVSVSVALNGTLLSLGYRSIVKRLDEIKELAKPVPTLQAKVEVHERDIMRHEDKLNDLDKNKADKQGL